MEEEAPVLYILNASPMYWSLVYYLDGEIEALDRIRRKCDPTVNLIRPHVPIVFPVPESVGKGRLLEHLDTIVRRSRRFPARFRGFAKTPDHWLYLKVENGNAEFVQLFESMYTGLWPSFVAMMSRSCRTRPGTGS